MSRALAGVLSAARAHARVASDAGFIVMFVSASNADDVSEIARDSAEGAAAPALLIDLDPTRDAHARAYANVLASPHEDAAVSRLFRVFDREGRRVSDAFMRRRARGLQVELAWCDAARNAGARVQISSEAAAWNALRADRKIVVVDAPALDRSQAALKLARSVDCVIQVVSPAAKAAPAAMEAHLALKNAGATMAGLVFAKASAPVIALDRLTRAAG